MSKIIFSLVSGLSNSKLPCLYEGFINALAREGNEVLVMINNELISNCWRKNKSVPNLDKKKLNEKILEFNPDLVIAWNNSLYEEIPTITTCPIIIYGTDSPAVFSDRDILKKNIGRYNVILAGAELQGMIKEYFGEGYRSMDVVRFASDFEAENIPQDKNISFIGTNFNFAKASVLKKLYDFDFKQDKIDTFCEFLNSFQKDIFKKPESHLNALKLDSSLLGTISHIDLLNLISSNTRIQILSAIADLGLSLYGSKNWFDVIDYSIPLALSYKVQEISSVKENQDIYNSSKISINISHAQAGSSFSWRVRDIMACNSALISDPRQDLITEFSEYVKIPTYENPFEARKLCEKLLKDEIWRKEIVENSQRAIKEKHRFKHRMRDIEQIIGVSLFNNKPGKIEFLRNKEFLKAKEEKSEKVYDDKEVDEDLPYKKIYEIQKNNFYKKKGLIKRVNRYRILWCRKIKEKLFNYH